VDSGPPRSRVDQLAQRVHWFDAHRHQLAIGIAIAFGVFGWWIVPHMLGPDWPPIFVRFLTTGASLMLGVTIEVGLAGALAVWEAEHDRLIREHRLPPARLLRPKTKTAP
jgi:hypothetical protein